MVRLDRSAQRTLTLSPVTWTSVGILRRTRTRVSGVFNILSEISTPCHHAKLTCAAHVTPHLVYKMRAHKVKCLQTQYSVTNARWAYPTFEGPKELRTALALAYCKSRILIAPIAIVQYAARF